MSLETFAVALRSPRLGSRQSANREHPSRTHPFVKKTQLDRRVQVDSRCWRECKTLDGPVRVCASKMSLTRKRSSRAIVRRFLLRAVRNLSLEAQAGILIGTGVVVGLALGFAISWGGGHSSGCTRPLLPSDQRSVSIASGDKCGDKNSPCFVFVFGTGRSGTQHLSRVLSPKASPPAAPVYITHEEEHLSVRTKLIVQRDYRRLASSVDEAHFTLSANEYVSSVKIPFYNALLRRHGAKRLVYTGHLPMVFGLGPSLVEKLPEGTVRVLRMRRDRIATAVSLMALGPESQDPWGATTERGEDGKLKSADSVNRRWFPKPTDAMVRLGIDQTSWARLNRFQRWLWYVDDVECRWQALRRGFGGEFSWMEESLENINVLDGGIGWERVAEFIGVRVNWSQTGKRDNSIEHKMRSKIHASETSLRKWDREYRQAVGRCRISGKLSYGWDEHDSNT